MRTLNKTSSSADISLTWTNAIKIAEFLIKERLDFNELIKTYKIKIFDLSDNLLKEYTNFKEGDFSTNIVSLALSAPPVARRAIVFASPKKIASKVVEAMTYRFAFPFQENIDLYYQKNNKEGFFDSLKIHVISEDGDDTNDVEITTDYAKINPININNILKKVFKNIEGTALKLKFNKDEYLKNEVQAVLLVPQTESIKNNFKYIFIDDIENKWISVLNDESSLTVPFPNLYTLNNQEAIAFDIYLLNKCQKEMFYNFKDKPIDENEKILVFTNYLTEQKISLASINDETQEIRASYQNFFYLFNEESFNNIAWPTQSTLINGINYLKYFPLKSDELNNNTYLINILPKIETSAIATTNSLNNPALGYKSTDLEGIINDNFIEQDLASSNHLNIKTIEIKNVINENNEVSMYIEVVTNFINKLNFKLLNMSNNLFFIDKYYTGQDDVNYLTFLFKVKYTYINNTENLLKKQLIQDRIFINFDFEII